MVLIVYYYLIYTIISYNIRFESFKCCSNLAGGLIKFLIIFFGYKIRLEA
jgi:hypothetical protein